MNQIKNGKLIVDGLTYKLVLEPEVDEWKPIPGLYYEFSDSAEFINPKVARYRGLSDSIKYPFNVGCVNWSYCRPLQDHNLIQMIPWEGGECPVPDETWVLARFKDGLYLFNKARDFLWVKGTNLEAYAVLK